MATEIDDLSSFRDPKNLHGYKSAAVVPAMAGRALRRIAPGRPRLQGMRFDAGLITWSDDMESFGALTTLSRERRRQDEAGVAMRRVVRGFCLCCRRRAVFSVRGGQPPRAEVNLREGLVCQRCGLNNRMRLLYQAVHEWQLAHDDTPAAIYVAEELSPFYERLSRRFDRVTGSEYVPSAGASGAVVALHGLQIHHQDLRSLSFEDETFDLVVHADVLEHVPGHRGALAEIQRVLVPGGETLFTAPFMPNREKNLVRATISADGEIVHHLEPEIHGDPLDPAGALVFQTFGCQLLDDLREAGFDLVQIGFLADAALAITSGVLFRARKVAV